MTPIVREIQARSIMSRSKLSDYAVNCYVGCAHGCRYCYACYMRDYTGHQEPWGGFVDVKANAVEVMEREARRKQKGEVLFSSVCDGWQPLEERYALTRRCLQRALEHGHGVSILTKSKLVTRDFDILSYHKKKVDVGFTITTMDEPLARILEPRASTPCQRLDAMEMADRQGISLFLFFGPLIPGLTDTRESIQKVLSSVCKIRLRGLYVDKLNYAGKFIAGLEEALDPSEAARLRSGFAPMQYRGGMIEYSSMLRKRVMHAVRACGIRTHVEVLF